MDKDTFSRISAIALNNIFGYEPRFSHNIIDALGSTEAVFGLPEDEKERLFGTFGSRASDICERSLEEASAIYDRITEDGASVCTIFDDSYPELLKECSDAPIVLYVKGVAPSEIFNRKPAVSVVGTRDISSYGAEWCRRIVESLSESPVSPVIVSGLAIGVDICAHRAALEAGIPTVAVLPVGIESIYPRRHARDAAMIAETGALVTDYPPGTSPAPFNFLRRNRIIAGFSRATILVESKDHGGGTMTARLAAGYGRDVFALPGRIDDLRSAGCNRLIGEKIAEPITSLECLGEALGLGRWNRRKKEGLESEVRSHFCGRLPDEEVDTLCRIAAEIKRNRGIMFEELCRSLDLNYAAVSTMASLLEADGFIIVDLFQGCSINTRIC